MSASRVISLALLALSNATLVGAQADEDAAIPAIFSDVPPRSQPYTLKLEPPPIVRAPLPLSQQLRAVLAERMTALATAHPEPPAARPSWRAWMDNTGDAILMDRFVVQERKERKIEVEDVPSYFARVFTTGTIFESKQSGAIPSIYWGLHAPRAPKYGTVSTAPGIQLAFTWRW